MIRKFIFAFLFVFVFCISITYAQIKLVKVAGNLVRPVDISVPGDGSGRLFFVLQNGKIVIYNGTSVLSTPFLNVTSSVSCCGERGLLSLAFHPNYKTNGFFYIYYTATNGDVVVARYTVSTNSPNLANANSKLVLLTVAHSQFSNHNGGKLAFGPDGFLYISIGDGGSGGDPNNNAQNLGRLLGKILRINVNSGTRYSIPSGNPFVGTAGAKKEIWALGVRNPWRYSFDRQNGDLYIADVGQNSFEEINFQRRSSLGGENYGWRRMEGKHCYNPTTGCNTGTLKMPVLEYDHNAGCSITGGYVYRGTKIPAIAGMYLYSDYCNGSIRGAKRVNGVWTTTLLLSTPHNISTFGQNEAGELYIADHDSTAGAVYRIAKQ